MFLTLSEKSFIKLTPEKDVYCFFKDGVRNTTLLNDSASNILRLCDGTHSFNDIITILATKYNENETVVEKNVKEFLSPLITFGLIKELDLRTPFQIEKGSSTIYYPEGISLEITDCCPLKCRHCYLPNKNHFIISRKDIDELLKIIDESGIYSVQITGGEALTHPDLDYIIDQLVDRGILISISTSGMIFNDNIFNTIIKIKKVLGSFVRVSLDGNEVTHNYIRRNDNSYKNAIKFIKKLKELDVPCQVGTTVINQSKDELEDLTCLAKKLGVSLIEIGIVCIQGNAKDNNIKPTFTTKELYSFLKELSKKYSDDNFVVKVPVEIDTMSCGAGYRMLRIKPNLNITPCPMTDFIIGDLQKESIADVMKKCGKKFHDFISPCKKFCDNCKEQVTCNGCIAQGLNSKDSVSKCAWFESQGKILLDYLQ